MVDAVESIVQHLHTQTFIVKPHTLPSDWFGHGIGYAPVVLEDSIRRLLVRDPDLNPRKQQHVVDEHRYCNKCTHSRDVGL